MVGSIKVMNSESYLNWAIHNHNGAKRSSMNFVDCKENFSSIFYHQGRQWVVRYILHLQQGSVRRRLQLRLDLLARDSKDREGICCHSLCMNHDFFASILPFPLLLWFLLFMWLVQMGRLRWVSRDLWLAIICIFSFFLLLLYNLITRKIFLSVFW